MRKYLLIMLLSTFSLFFSSCATKVDDAIDNSNTADVSILLEQLVRKEKEMNDIIKELEHCNATKKREE